MRSAARRLGSFGAAALVAAFLVAGSPSPASARVHVFIGAGLPYPYYAYPYYPYPPYPYVAYPAVPPPGWVPGHWEYRYDPYGRRYPVWVPPHLR